MFMEPSHQVRVRNVGDAPFRGKHQRNVYIVQPGDEELVPFGAAVLWLGDNDKRDRPEKRDRSRTEEKKRINQRWGNQIPPLEVYSLDGDQILMLSDDLDDRYSATVTPSVADSEALEARIAELEKATNDLKTKANRKRRAEKAGAKVKEDVPTDARQVQGPEAPPEPVSASA